MKSIAIRLVACAAVIYWAWTRHGPEGLVYSSLVLALAFARPIVDSVIGAFSFLRQLAYRDVEGRQYAYKGKLIDVAEDEHHHQWLRLSDVRKVIPDFPRDKTLRRLLGPGVASFGSERGLRIQDEALLAYLGMATSLESAKFKAWVEKSVVYPARRAREFGATPQAPSDSGTP